MKRFIIWASLTYLVLIPFLAYSNLATDYIIPILCEPSFQTQCWSKGEFLEKYVFFVLVLVVANFVLLPFISKIERIKSFEKKLTSFEERLSVWIKISAVNIVVFVVIAVFFQSNQEDWNDNIPQANYTQTEKFEVRSVPIEEIKNDGSLVILTETMKGEPSFYINKPSGWRKVTVPQTEFPWMANWTELQTSDFTRMLVPPTCKGMGCDWTENVLSGMKIGFVKHPTKSGYKNLSDYISDTKESFKSSSYDLVYEVDVSGNPGFVYVTRDKVTTTARLEFAAVGYNKDFEDQVLLYNFTFSFPPNISENQLRGRIDSFTEIVKMRQNF